MSGTIATTGALSASGTITLATTTVVGTTYTANGAISEKEGVIFIDSVAGINLTLAAPTSGTDDGKILTIVYVTPSGSLASSGSAGSSTVAIANDAYGTASSSHYPEPKFNNVILSTLQGSGNFYGYGTTVSLVAYQGHWRLLFADVYTAFS